MEIILGYLGRSNIITKVLKSERKASESREKMW